MRVLAVPSRAADKMVSGQRRPSAKGVGGEISDQATRAGLGRRRTEEWGKRREEQDREMERSSRTRRNDVVR